MVRPVYARATPAQYRLLNSPGTAIPVTNSVVHKTTCRSRRGATAWYAVVAESGAARAFEATHRDGSWHDEAGAILPSGVLLFDTAPRARGWAVANMGAASRVCEPGAEPIGCVP